MRKRWEGAVDKLRRLFNGRKRGKLLISYRGLFDSRRFYYRTFDYRAFDYRAFDYRTFESRL